ncbi:APC family permease [Thalassiella azotivora]
MVGLGAMLGAGVFAAFAPAAGAAGGLLLVSLAVAAVVAYCNATSSARLAARHPQSGGTYVYGRERLGPFWGYLAGWGFVVGKTASCAAMALTVGWYAWPEQATWVAVATVVALTVVNYLGVQRSVAVTRVVVAVVLVVLAAVVVAVATSAPGVGDAGGAAGGAVRGPTPGPLGVLQGAGFLFFAFAGYARLATLGEEVRAPARTIPRAVPVALGATLVTYALVALAVLHALGPDGVASTSTPVAEAVSRSTWATWLEPAVRVGAVVAAAGSLLSLQLGVSRTTLAMARDGHLPRTLAAVHPRHAVPHHAELAVALVVVVVVLLADVRDAIGFSSVAVLVYYAVANASALRLDGDRVVPVVGLVGCLAVALSLPASSVLAGGAVLVVGAALWWVRARSTDGGVGARGAG